MKTRRGFLKSMSATVAAIPAILLLPTRGVAAVAGSPPRTVGPIAMTGDVARKLRPCRRCGGIGVVPIQMAPGAGIGLRAYMPDATLDYIQEHPCPRCEGSGVEPVRNCDECDDAGYRMVPDHGRSAGLSTMVVMKRVDCWKCKDLVPGWDHEA